jgi:signal recognition particle receptor subunit alpha
VVLVDTAGRMQNKEPLMRALAKLVSDNEPDLVLFVGEALVGNDGIDQLSVFNQALANYSPPGAWHGALGRTARTDWLTDPPLNRIYTRAGKTHQIDGIILTKFDTVDEKVGAALSMCYKTGQPIMFVGTGQKYTHLKKLQPAMILNCLFR